MVFDRIGKKATIQAQMSSDSGMLLLVQMMISGAMATIGVTCSTTA